MSTNFHLAPPSKTVDGLLCVPIDIESIDAVFTFDGTTQTAVADATITYTVGPTAGNPIFDLRQNITSAWVDGAVFAVAQLAHHDFGVDLFTNLRVIEAVQTAGSVHTLRVQYDLALPDAQFSGGYLPALEWLAGPKLHFAFGMSDLRRARYVEAFLPANLIFDQFSIDLEIQITGAMAAHSVITNGTVTDIATNHWSIAFPPRFTALSPMLEIHASDRVTQQIDSVVLPVSGNNVTIEAWKPTSGTLSTTNLTTEIDNIKTFLTDNENDYGAYVHGDRFVAFFNGGGMEYEGGTITGTGPLLHETFHSWFARGIKPASQADGWWDEGFTEFHDDGASDAIPFDFTDAPVTLCSRDPWQRHTPNSPGASSYTEGNLFWKGIASQIGVGTLNGLMSDFYEEHKSNPVSTQMIEEFLLSKSGNENIVDAFHRFIYGFGDPSPVPDLWLRDEVGDPGDDLWSGTFWDSPDLWIRNNDDGGTSHQEPEFGQDNWFHARVRNKAGAGTARHFVVTFNIPGFLATEFDYPDIFLPCIAAKADFELAAGDTRIVKAKWPRELIPPEDTHTCMLASVITRSDHPVIGRHVWEDNNLAQKNLTVVDLEEDDTFYMLPIVIRNWRSRFDPRFELEVWKPEVADGLNISLIHRSKDFLKASKAEVRLFMPQVKDDISGSMNTQPDCGGGPEKSLSGFTTRRLSSANPEAVLRRFPNSWEAAFDTAEAPLHQKIASLWSAARSVLPANVAWRHKTRTTSTFFERLRWYFCAKPFEVAKLAVNIPQFTQNVVGLKIAVTEKFKSKKPVKLHFVQRNVKTQQIVGGVAVQLRRK